MPKVRPQSFPVTSKGMNMARKATVRNRRQVANRRNAQLPEMNLQSTVNATMPNIVGGNATPKNTSSNPILSQNSLQDSTPLVSAQGSAPLTSTTNPQSVLSSGFQTNFNANPMRSMKPNNISEPPTGGPNDLGGGGASSRVGQRRGIKKSGY